MPEFKVYVTVYHRIDVEANSAEEAKELAKEEIWDDHIKDVIIDVEDICEVEDKTKYPEWKVVDPYFTEKALKARSDS